MVTFPYYLYLFAAARVLASIANKTPIISPKAIAPKPIKVSNRPPPSCMALQRLNDFPNHNSDIS